MNPKAKIFQGRALWPFVKQRDFKCDAKSMVLETSS